MTVTLDVVVRGLSNFLSSVNLLAAGLMKSRSNLAYHFGCSPVPYSTRYIVPTYVASHH